ncbi:hypothetical protein BS47DRAFT_1380463 [Hydnum rufescens UP504]|uniref:Pentatricopeptide repeat-containing protein n=1 Tax=Hydnum rufescens UP504 TaxID=1448309 RepID=A0A9P6E019_9AGAM|nr:hypothetical protein BS47DRAFT_1380463 [Hydnum rufescens UP504]
MILCSSQFPLRTACIRFYRNLYPFRRLPRRLTLSVEHFCWNRRRIHHQFDISKFIATFVSTRYTEDAVWSLPDLIPQPERQREIRAILQTHAIDEFQFLRWRNALIARTLQDAISNASYGLSTTPSIFESRARRLRDAKNVPTVGDRIQRLHSHPYWLVLSLVSTKINMPWDITFALDLVIPHIANTSLGHARVPLIRHLIDASAQFTVLSILPSLIDIFLVLPSVEVRLVDYHAILRALIRTPRGETLVFTSPRGYDPYRKHRTVSGLLYQKDTQILRVLETMRRRDIDISDEATATLIIRSVPPPSSSITHFILNHRKEKQLRLMETSGEHIDEPIEFTDALFKSHVRASASTGNTLQTGIWVDKIRRQRIEARIPIVPISSGYNKNAYATPSNSPVARPPAPKSQFTSDQIGAHPTADSIQTPPLPVNVTSRGRINRELISSLNAILLSSFTRDHRSRDPERFPHALFAYFRRLQTHEDAVGDDLDMAQLIEDSRWKDRLWSTMFTALAAQTGFPASKLVDSFEAVVGSGKAKLDIPALTSIVRGLVKKGDRNNAMRIWEEYLASGVSGPLDLMAVSAGVRVLAESGRLLDAFDLFDSVAVKGNALRIPDDDLQSISFVTDRYLRKRDTTRAQRLFPDIVHATGCLDSAEPPVAMRIAHKIEDHPQRQRRLDVVLLTDYIRILGHLGRPDVAYMLWDNMEAIYGVRPNDQTLNTILLAASSYSTRESARGMLDMLGWNWTSRRPSLGATSKEEDAEELSGRIRTILMQKRTSGNGFWWGSQIAWQRARDIFREVILGNYPSLKHVPIPAVANPDGFAPLLKAKFASSDARGSSNEGGLGRLGIGIGTYYDIVPSRRAFDAYMRLLCNHGLESEIPQALAWQRALEIFPSRNTLRMALMHFAEVGSGAPFMEELIGQSPDESPYGTLKAWIYDWVGKKHCPTEFEIAKARAFHAGEPGSPRRREYERELEQRRARWRRSQKDLRKRAPKKTQNDLGG